MSEGVRDLAGLAEASTEGSVWLPGVFGIFIGAQNRHKKN